MKPIHHVALSIVIAGGSYALTSSPQIAAVTFAVGALLDSDHLIDSRGKPQLSSSFYEKQEKLLILLHSYELLIPLWLLALVFGFLPLALWVSIAFVAHLVTDQVAYRPHLLFYSLLFRASRGFKSQDIQGSASSIPQLEALYTLCGIYVIVHSTLLVDYVPTPEATETIKLLAALQWFVPALLLTALVPRVSRALVPILPLQLWTDVGLVAAAVSVALQLAGIPGLWWSWSTMGLLIILVITIANAAKAKLGQVNALLLGTMVTLLAIASWETIYQTGLLFYHDFFGSRAINYAIVVAEQLTWVFPALIVILVLYRRYGSCIYVSRVVLVYIAAAAIFTTIWFVGGMEIPLLWYQGPEGIVGPIENVMANPIMLMVSRGSQSFWLLGIASLFITGSIEKG